MNNLKLKMTKVIKDKKYFRQYKLRLFKIIENNKNCKKYINQKGMIQEKSHLAYSVFKKQFGKESKYISVL